MPYDLISGNFISGYDDEVESILAGGHYRIGAPLAAYGGAAMAPGLARAMAQRQTVNQQLQQGQAWQQALAFKQAQSGQLLSTMQPSKARKQVLGMVSNGTIAAAGTATITARPQTFAFKPERIFVPATVGPDFTIQDIKVGNVSQLVQSGDLPAEAFSQTAFGVEMDMDTVQTSQDFIVQVTNISGGARTFRAMILGKSANG